MHSYCLVPETAAQCAILLTWPHRNSAWADSLEAVTTVYLDIARAVVAHEKLLVVCYDPDLAGEVRQACTRAGIPLDAIHFFPARTNDTWIRDYGPLAVSDGTGLRLLDFVFDGWGKKYPAALDNEVTRKLESDGCVQHPLPALPARSRGRQHRYRWPGQPADHLELPDHEQPQPGLRQSGI